MYQVDKLIHKLSEPCYAVRLMAHYR